MTNFIKITNLLSGLVLIRFSLSKLFAWPISVNAFIEMAKPIGIDPTFFRLFTGVIITIICLGYFYSFYLLVKEKIEISVKTSNHSLIVNVVGIGVMVGALISEFFLRVNPKWPLVFIALFIIISSIINIYTLKKTSTLRIFN